MNMIISLLGLFIIGIIVAAIVLAAVLITKGRKSKPVRVEKQGIKATLGETLKSHRTRCNMTQEYVAETIGVSRQAVSKWEQGISDPSTSNLIALSKVYGISTAELLKSVE